MIEIREEKQADYAAVRDLNARAFGCPDEGLIVDVLRDTCENTLSLVADKDGAVVGHIFFSPVTVNDGEQQIIGMGLAPMAVLPEFQNQGIGTMLVTEGIERIKRTEFPFIIVLGHENFYPRFGFERASLHGLKTQWEGIPDGAFMVIILDGPRMDGVTGVATYRSEFDAAM